jgi:hypothetical protein
MTDAVESVDAEADAGRDPRGNVESGYSRDKTIHPFSYALIVRP